MKNICLILIWYISIAQAFAVDDDNILGISHNKLRRWDVDLDDIPTAITHAIDFFMGIAATVSVIFIVVGAYKILFWSLQQDKTKGRDTIIAALGWLALAALAWMIIKIIINTLS